MTALDQLRPLVGIQRACQALAVPRATCYRRWRLRFSLYVALLQKRRGDSHPVHSQKANSPRCWRVFMRSVFRTVPPAQVYAALLDEGRFHCSIRTMYRLLETHGESRERRDQLTHPPYQKPEVLATQANQLWSWGITKLRGPVKWTAYHLYAILEIFSRYVVG